jgi:hypothetical protein
LNKRKKAVVFDPDLRYMQSMLWFMLAVIGMVLSFVGWLRWAT